ncbi:DUF2267 domain-containing protein [Nonomuraea wenchangensis]
MDYQEFITIVEQAADVPAEEAERVSCLTLRTLARRITMGEAEDLGERLPDRLRPCVQADGPTEKFHLDEFIRRIAEQMEVDPDTAERRACGVLAALWRAVGPDEFDDLRSELPSDFAPLLDTAAATVPPQEEEPPFTGNLSYDTFLDRVRERAGIGRDHAARAADAVLEVLGLRLTGGQVRDLIPLLPLELRPALRRGDARSKRGAVPISPDVFLHDVAKREGVTQADAHKDVRAVFAVLREAIGEKEYHDTVAQLPGEYRPLLKQG